MKQSTKIIKIYLKNSKKCLIRVNYCQHQSNNKKTWGIISFWKLLESVNLTITVFLG